MKILVRKWNSEENRLEYVWKQISNKPNAVQPKQFRDIDGNVYSEMDVLKIIRDTRKLYNFCKNCGKLVKPGDEEKHYAEKEKNINCFECRNLRTSATGRYLKKKYAKQEDGTYIKTVKEEVNLCCGASYYNKTIEKAKEDKDSNCPYFKCRGYGVAPYAETIFMKYPKMYDVFATEKSLMDNKFYLDYINTGSHTRQYRHNRLKNLTAIVDDNGIVKDFYYTYRGTVHQFIYAKAYDKFFSIDYSGYRTFSLDWSLSETTKENIMSLVRKVYESKEEKGGK